jgi:uncharacterized protein YbjT (DUF2867 family)
MQTLIIGANGNLGHEIAIQLSKTEKVKAGIRNENNFLTTKNVKNVVFDYDKSETFNQALHGVNKVFLQAPPLDAQAYERLTPFINTLKEKGINRVVFNSAWGVDHNEEAPLRKIERKLINEGFDYTFTRPNFFIENFTSGFASHPLQNDHVIVHNAGDAKLTFVSTQDIAEVVVDAFKDDKHIGKAYNLSGKEALSHQDVADFFSKKMNTAIHIVSLSPEDMKAGAMENGLPESVADYLVMLYNIASEGHMAHMSDDIKIVLGREPKTFEDIVTK